MKEENLNALISAINEKKRCLTSIANDYAISHVKSGNASDREAAKQYLSKIDIWEDARKLIIEYSNKEIK